MWALAIVALVGLCLHPAYTLYTKLLWVLLALPLLAAIVKTGSRAGIGSLADRVFSVLSAALALAAEIIHHTPGASWHCCHCLLRHEQSVATQRWQQALQEGKFDGREKIMPASLEMFIERPFLGWQPVKFQYELGRRVLGTGSGTKDAHNLFLHLLLEVGLVGTVPFLIGLWRCAQAAWQARTGHLGLLPLALLLTALAAAMTHTDLLRETVLAGPGPGMCCDLSGRRSYDSAQDAPAQTPRGT